MYLVVFYNVVALIFNRLLTLFFINYNLLQYASITIFPLSANLINYRLDVLTKLQVYMYIAQYQKYIHDCKYGNINGPTHITRLCEKQSML